MAAIGIIVTCPERPAAGNLAPPGFWSAGRHWPVGDTAAELDEEIVAAMEGEVLRRESILTIARAGGGVTAPPPAPPGSVPVTYGELRRGEHSDPWRFPPSD